MIFFYYQTGWLTQEQLFFSVSFINDHFTQYVNVSIPQGPVFFSLPSHSILVHHWLYPYHFYLMSIAPMYIHNLNLSWELKKCMHKCLTHHLHLDFRSTRSSLCFKKLRYFYLKADLCSMFPISGKSLVIHPFRQTRNLVVILVTSLSLTMPEPWRC